MTDPYKVMREVIEAGLRHDRDAEAARRAMTAGPLSIASLERAIEAVVAAPYEPDPMHALMTEHLDRLAAAFHPGGLLECPVEGCGWRLAVVRPTLVDDRLDLVRFRGELRYEGAAREAVERAVAEHVDGHAATSETGLDVRAVVDPDEFARHDAP